MIEWRRRNEVVMDGYVKGKRVYYVGEILMDDEWVLVADAAKDTEHMVWYGYDIPVDCTETGMQWCEMHHATGA